MPLYGAGRGEATCPEDPAPDTHGDKPEQQPEPEPPEANPAASAECQ